MGFKFLSSYRVNDGIGIVYDADAKALFDSFTTPASDADKATINKLIVALKACGRWATLDECWITTLADSQASRRNWINPSQALTPTNSPTFTAYRGYVGDGATSSLDSPNTFASLPKFTQNSASMSVWVQSAAAAGADRVIGSTSSALAFVQPRTSGDLVGSRLNDATAVTASAPSGDGTGFHTLSRAGSGSYDKYRNGALLTSPATASTALVGGNPSLLRGSTTYSTRRVAAGLFGGPVDAAMEAATYSAMLTFMQTMGAA